MTTIVKDVGTYEAGEDIEDARRVKLDFSNGKAQVVKAQSGEMGIGMVDGAAVEGAPAAVIFWTHSRTYRVSATGAIALGDKVSTDNDGKFKKAANNASNNLFHALGESLAADDMIEVLPNS